MKLVPNLLDDTYIKPIDDSKMFYITNDGNVWWEREGSNE